RLTAGAPELDEMSMAHLNSAHNDGPVLVSGHQSQSSQTWILMISFFASASRSSSFSSLTGGPVFSAISLTLLRVRTEWCRWCGRWSGWFVLVRLFVAMVKSYTRCGVGAGESARGKGHAGKCSPLIRDFQRSSSFSPAAFAVSGSFLSICAVLHAR